MARKSSKQILAELQATDDGLVVRPIGVWSLEKLAILHLYFQAFTRACGRAGGGYYVDGLAGPGICEVRDAVAPPRFVWGSPLLALRTSPPFIKCIFLEVDRPQADALRQRTEAHRGRAIVKAGDVNRELAGLVRNEVPSAAPCFCLLDPEGVELTWDTIRSVAAVPRVHRKPELLILFPTGWLTRLLPTGEDIDASGEARLDAWFPDATWRTMHQARVRGDIAPSVAKSQYLEAYRKGLERLGYRAFSHAVKAPSAPGGKRREQYHLVFATQHSAGETIMRDVFARPYILDFPVSGRLPLFEG